MDKLKLDPVGYFLIRTWGKRIGLAFCRYQDKKPWYKNRIEKKLYSEDPKVLLRWVKAKKLISRKDHYDYLKRELKKAKTCQKKGTRYRQP